MYPLQPSYELDNQIHSRRVLLQPDQILNDSLNLATHQTTRHNLPPLNSRTGTDLGKQLNRRRSFQEKILKQRNRNNDDEAAATGIATAQKRILHRDIERQRRQEMATLYASLRSLLPLEYIKGKRAVSDHMQEAVNYIKCLQTNISELLSKRDKLSKMSSSLRSNLSSGIIGNANSSSTAACVPICTDISVSPCTGGGLEILISTSPKEAVFSLSRVLQMLLSQGLDVVCCVSTTVDDMKVHKIQSEVTDGGQTNIDILELQQKLTRLISPPTNAE